MIKGRLLQSYITRQLWDEWHFSHFCTNYRDIQRIHAQNTLNNKGCGKCFCVPVIYYNYFGKEIWNAFPQRKIVHMAHISIQWSVFHWVSFWNITFIASILKYNFSEQNIHDDVIKWKHFPRYWPFVRGIHRPRWIPRTKASDAENVSIWWRHHVNRRQYILPEPMMNQFS